MQHRQTFSLNYIATPGWRQIVTLYDVVMTLLCLLRSKYREPNSIIFKITLFQNYFTTHRPSKQALLLTQYYHMGYFSREFLHENKLFLVELRFQSAISLVTWASVFNSCSCPCPHVIYTFTSFVLLSIIALLTPSTCSFLTVLLLYLLEETRSHLYHNYILASKIS